jgi:hypothetical protein
VLIDPQLYLFQITNGAFFPARSALHVMTADMRELRYQAGLLILLPCFLSYPGRASFPASGDRAFISKTHQTPLLHCPAASFNAPDQSSLLSFLRQERHLAGLATAKVLFFKGSMKCECTWCSTVPLPHQSMTSVCTAFFVAKATSTLCFGVSRIGLRPGLFLGVVGAWQMSHSVVLLRPTALAIAL